MITIKIYSDASFKSSSSYCVAWVNVYKNRLLVDDYFVKETYNAPTSLCSEFRAVYIALRSIRIQPNKIQVYSDCRLVSDLFNNNCGYPDSIALEVADLRYYDRKFKITWNWLNRKHNKIKQVHKLAYERI